MVMEEQRQVNRGELVVGHAQVTQVGQGMQEIGGAQCIVRDINRLKMVLV